SVPDAVAAMKLGAIDFLSKPVSPRALRRMVTEVVERHREASPEGERNEPLAGRHLSVAEHYAENMNAAKRALNQRDFAEAEIYPRQAIALLSDSPEAHNLMGVLHECRNEHDASYREYKAALKADSQYEPAKNNMKRFYERYTFGRTDLTVDTG